MCGTRHKNIQNWTNLIKSHENEDWGILTLQGKYGTKLLKYLENKMCTIISVFLI